MILLWGSPADAPMRLVCRALAELGSPWVFVDQDELHDTHVELVCDPAISGVLEIRGGRYPLEDIRSMYLRPYDLEDLPSLAGVDRDSPVWRHGSTLGDVLWSFAEEADALVLNRPSSMISNGSKPYQGVLIEEQGFAIPETLITTDAVALREFQAEHGAVVYKSISGTRSIVKLLTAEHEGRMGDLHWCPTQFQALVEGMDYRVHAIGGRLFASRVVSEAVDYRYGETALEACDLPDDVAERCLNLADALGLGLAGIDLRRTPDDRWFCFEVNAAPGFSAYELVTGQPMSTAIAKLLAEGL